MKKLLLLFFLVGAIAPHNARAMDYVNIAQTGFELSIEMIFLCLCGNTLLEEYRIYTGKQRDLLNDPIRRRALILALGTYTALQLNKKAQDFSQYLQG